MRSGKSEWTDERVEMLKQHHADGLSAHQSAMILGGVSRLAIIGKRARLGLSMSREARIATHGPKPAPTPKPPRQVPDTRRLKVTAPPEVIDAMPVIVDDKPGVPLLTLRRFGQCRWPVQDGDAPADMMFCGSECVGSYCDPHRIRAYNPGASKPRYYAALGRNVVRR